MAMESMAMKVKAVDPVELAKRAAAEKQRKIEAEKQRKAAEKARKEAKKLKKAKDNAAREAAESTKTGRPSFEELIDVWYQSANGGWKASAKFMIGRFFADGMPENESSHSETVWMNLLALYVLDEEFSGKETQWVLIAQKAKTFLKREGVNVS